MGAAAFLMNLGFAGGGSPGFATVKHNVSLTGRYGPLVSLTGRYGPNAGLTGRYGPNIDVEA